MSVKSVYRKKAAFRVARMVEGKWVDLTGQSISYMAACEAVERLKLQYPTCYFKVLHEKLLPKRAA